MNKVWKYAIAAVVIAALAWALFWPIPRANAQTQCAPIIDLVSGLATKYGERAVSVGVSQRGHMIVMFANADSGTWTVIFLNPTGTGCIVDAGDAYQPPSELFMPQLLHGTRI